MSGHVFLSYQHDEAGSYVERLAAHLAEAGVPVWYDSELITGNRWTSVIREQIDRSVAFVVIMTPGGEESEWVNNEIHQAKRSHRPIFPLLLSGQPFFVLGNLQYQDVSGGLMPDPRLVRELRLLAANANSAVSAPVGLRMDVVGIRVEVPTDQPLILLREADGERSLPIRCDATEALPIAYAQAGTSFAAPLTHDLFRDALQAISARVERATIYGVEDDAFLASVTINGRVLRSRPSDAVALALKCGAPVFAAEEVLASAGIVLAPAQTS